jgi:putative ABC transport system permease protein
LGFRPGFLRRLIAGESLLIALAGGAIGVAATFPVTAAFGPALGTLFPVFQVSTQTILLQLCAALVIGLVAAVAPSIRASRVRIAEGLRAVG